MELLSPIVGIIQLFWDPVSRRMGYLKDLNKNMATLTNETEELKCKLDEIQIDVEAAASVGKTWVRQVENWLVDVRNIVTQVDLIKLEFEQGRTCLKGCCTDHFSRYKLGRRVVKRLKDVEILKGKAVFDKVAVSPRRPRVLEMQTSLPHGQQSTSEQTLEEIWGCLLDEKNSVLCVYGMGGIGKTTLMKDINNRLIGTSHFDVVIWITVSKDLNLESIQERIGNKLDITFHSNECLEEKRDKLFARLKNVRYMLILDDLWQAFSLDQVGIRKPDKQNRCKIVITTRSVEVSNKMRADTKIKVNSLTGEEAWYLFCDNAGDVILSPDIRPLAEKVARECGGLPLAIKTVGGALRHKDKKELWENALRALKGSAPEVPGMEREVFLPLRLSYDCLGDPKIQLCFLYCSLYPEDREIFAKDLVKYWAMEEGLIDNVNTLEEALNKGHDILERLKDACLLEKGSQGSKYVRMHDLVRDLAIWITSSPSSSSSSSIQALKFLVKAGDGLVQPPEEKMWRGIGRISLMHNKITDLQIMPSCPDLVSLLLCDNRQLHTIHTSFFGVMPKLHILDLSFTSIKLLPPSLSQLVNLHALILRHCRSLAEMPTLEQLKELQILDLSYTGIINLPEGIANLVKLKQLDLSNMYSLARIPFNIISGLTSLEDLSLLGRMQMSAATLREVATLTHLTSLAINISSLDGFAAHDMDHQMWSGLRRFNVHFGFQDEIYDVGGDKMIRIYRCDNFPCGMEGLIKHADYLRFIKCKGLECLSQLVGDAKSLRWLEVNRSKDVKCIIDWRDLRDDALECLENLVLYSLPNLDKVFYGGEPLQCTPFQALREIHVELCPKLRCLFFSSMAEHLHQLEELTVVDCDEMEEVVQGDTLPNNALPRLRYLHLRNLPKLSTICRQRPIFTSLEHIIVSSCPELKKLPLMCSTIQELGGGIRGNRKWWEGLEWEDDNSKSFYSAIYLELELKDEEEEETSEPELKGEEEEASETETEDEEEDEEDVSELEPKEDEEIKE